VFQNLTSFSKNYKNKINITSKITYISYMYLGRAVAINM